MHEIQKKHKFERSTQRSCMQMHADADSSRSSPRTAFARALQGCGQLLLELSAPGAGRATWPTRRTSATSRGWEGSSGTRRGWAGGPRLCAAGLPTGCLGLCVPCPYFSRVSVTFVAVRGRVSRVVFGPIDSSSSVHSAVCCDFLPSTQPTPPLSLSIPAILRYVIRPRRVGP